MTTRKQDANKRVKKSNSARAANRQKKATTKAAAITGKMPPRDAPNGFVREEAPDFNAPLADLESIPSVLLRQVHALKARYPEALLLFRVNENYEAFGEDATALHEILGVPLSNRKRKGPLSPQAGFEAAALDSFLTQLVKAGRKVAVCDQPQVPPTVREPEAAAAEPPNDNPPVPDPRSTADAGPDGIFHRVNPRTIRISPFQHRTVFDEAEMEELRKDIGKNGIHTALIIRKNPDAGEPYELVTGERRLRIAWELNLDAVPVFVRELTDRQVKELQWSENFRRINPNPLDEARGLNQMLEYHKTPDGLARYLAKPKAYLLTRLRLLDLIPTIQEMVHAGAFNLRDSLELATLAGDAQQSFFDQCCADWKTRKQFRIFNLSYTLDQFRCDLSRAVFDPKDKELLPEAGACTRCPFNSATYASLFPETEKKSVCNRQECFERKTSAKLRRMLTGAVAAHQPTAIVYTQLSKLWQTALDESPEIVALPRFCYYDIRTIETPEEPDRSDYGDEEDVVDDAEYAAEIADYQRAKEKYAADLQSGKLHIGLFIQTNSLSRVLFDPSRPRPARNNAPTVTAAQVQAAMKAGTITPDLLQGEMTRIQEREIRSKELDQEKIQATVHQQFGKKLDGEEPAPDLTPADQLGIRLLVYQALNYSAKASVEARIPRIEAGNDDGKPVPIIEWLANLSDAEFTFLVRKAIQCHCGATLPTAEAGQALVRMAEGIGVDVNGIRAAQTIIAKTRNDRANERLAALEKQLADLHAKPPKADDTATAA